MTIVDYERTLLNCEDMLMQWWLPRKKGVGDLKEDYIKKIRTPVMVLGLRSDFSQLVETTLRVEQSLEKDGSK